MSSIFTIVGPMGSGKSEMLIENIEALISENNKGFMIFKPKIDIRTPGVIYSRNKRKHKAKEIDDFFEITKYIKKSNIKYVFIDELQFIKLNGLKEFIIECHKKDLIVAAAGLDLTSELEVFKTTSEFMCYSTFVYKIQGDCKCGEKSIFTIFNGENKDDDVKIGDKEYIGVCSKCHNFIK